MESVTFYQNPKIDFLFGLFGAVTPTKQDKFKPVEVHGVDENGETQILNDFYRKKPGNDSLIKFQKLIQQVAKDAISQERIIRKPNKVEVILSISVTEKRYYEVDVDNLAKAVLDCLNEIAFEDDSQGATLICNKHIHPTKENGILVAITKLSETNQGFFNDIKLFSKLK